MDPQVWPQKTCTSSLRQSSNYSERAGPCIYVQHAPKTETKNYTSSYLESQDTYVVRATNGCIWHSVIHSIIVWFRSPPPHTPTCSDCWVEIWHEDYCYVMALYKIVLIDHVFRPLDDNMKQPETFPTISSLRWRTNTSSQNTSSHSTQR